MTNYRNPFTSSALHLRTLGLAVVPCPHSTGGKRPGIAGHNKWTQPPSAEFLKRLIGRWPDAKPANIGIVTGVSGPAGLTVVDIDDETLINGMIDRCGDTPLKTRTAGGGYHLYFRANGERETNLRSEGLDVDVKADRGIVIVPPSYDPATGVFYDFASGGWEDLHRLPCLKPGGLPLKERGSITVVQGGSNVVSLRGPLNPLAVTEGQRNAALFYQCRFEVGSCDDEAQLLDVALSFNAQFPKPLPESEVTRTAHGVWKYHQEGRVLLPGCEARFFISRTDAQLFEKHPQGADAFLLYQRLVMDHAARAEPFAVCGTAMARDAVFAAWGSRRFYRACQSLVDLGLLTVIYRSAQSGKGDTSLFKLSQPHEAQLRAA